MLVHEAAARGVADGELEVAVYKLLRAARIDVVALGGITVGDAVRLEFWVPFEVGLPGKVGREIVGRDGRAVIGPAASAGR